MTQRISDERIRQILESDELWTETGRFALDLRDARARIADLNAIDAALVKVMTHFANDDQPKAGYMRAMIAREVLDSPPVAEFRERLEADRADAEQWRNCCYTREAIDELRAQAARAAELETEAHKWREAYSLQFARAGIAARQNRVALTAERDAALAEVERLRQAIETAITTMSLPLDAERLDYPFALGGAYAILRLAIEKADALRAAKEQRSGG